MNRKQTRGTPKTKSKLFAVNIYIYMYIYRLTLTSYSARLSNDELRRQIHIQSEQKRRAQIKDGFEELKQHLPGCSQKKLSKAALLTRTVQQLEHMKKMQNELLAEVERLVKENSSLKKFAAAVDTHM